MTTLSIIGGGRVGKALGLAWTRNGTMTVQDVVCRSGDSAAAAVAAIGAGSPLTSLDDVRRADVYLLTTPDDYLPDMQERLAKSVDLTSAIVFHTSGWLTSRALEACSAAGASVGSVHPIKSFTDPETSVATLPGTYCGIEGDDRAVQLLRVAFESFGANVLDIEADKKPIYHTTTIIGCNYVVALVDLAQRALGEAGIDRPTAQKMLVPLLTGTLRNLDATGPVGALTGPISRGDASTVAAHLGALQAWEPEAAQLYSKLGALAVEIARQQGTSDDLLRGVSEALEL